MQELDDNALLREYVERDSEEAFAVAVIISTAAATAAKTVTTAATATAATHTTVSWINIKSLSAMLVTTIAAGTGTYLVQQQEARRLRNQNENLAAQQQTLSNERDAVLASTTANNDDLERLRNEKIELLRLRGEANSMTADH